MDSSNVADIVANALRLFSRWSHIDHKEISTMFLAKEEAFGEMIKIK